MYMIIYNKEKGKNMNINKKNLCWASLLTLLTAYVLPSRLSEEGAFLYGYPFGYFEIRKGAFDSGGIILSSTSLDLFLLALNIFIFYMIIKFINQKNLSKRI